MRLRVIAVLAVAAAAFAVWHYRGQLPDRMAFIMGLRHEVQGPRISLFLDPAGPAANEFFAVRVHLEGADGRPLPQMTVRAHFTIVGVDHTGHDVALRDKQDGNYEARAALDLAGHWEVVIDAAQDGRHARAKYEMDVTPPQREGHSDEDDRDD